MLEKKRRDVTVVMTIYFFACVVRRPCALKAVDNIVFLIT